MIFRVSITWILLLFMIDKLVQAVFFPPSFIRNYVDDLLLIPLIMGVSLQLQQYLIAKDFTFSFQAILATAGFFGLVFEGIAPQISSAYTRDILDLVAYFIGAIFFAKFMNYPAVNSKA